MRNITSILLTAFFPALFVHACKAQKQDDDKSLLWKISGKGMQKSSYLFGTIHLICPDDYLWTDAMKRSLAAADKVCFELDMDDPSMLMQASTGMMNTGSKKLRGYFTPEQYARLKQFAKDSMDADISQMQMMKPMILQMLFTTKMVSCSFPASYEANIMEEAKKAKKEVVGIEAVQEQLDVFKNFPDDSAVAQTMQFVDSFAESKREFARMLASYKAQDLPALYEQTIQSKELGDQLDVFLDDRNKKWIPRIMQQMKGGSVFFAVGAAHLYGPTGVINLLRKEGYTVSPLH